MVSFHDWPFAAVAVTGLMYSSWKTAKNGWLLLNNQSPSGQEPSNPGPPLELIGKELRGYRPRWISLSEFTLLQTQFSDLIFIDLRDGDQWDVLPIRAPVTAFCVRRHELSDTLERLPENRIVVFYGVTDLDALLIGVSSRAKAAAPIYILDFEAEYPEGA